MKVEKEVKKCDRCGELYEVILPNPDWKISYLDEPYDLCGPCYNIIASMLKSSKPTVKGGIKNEQES